MRNWGFLALGLAAIVTASCSGGSGAPAPASGQSGPMVLPRIDGDLAVSAALPAQTVGEEQPSEGVGTVHSAQWSAEVGGFTQHQYSEVLGFPPGTKITIRNLSKTTSHTLDVVKEISGPPAVFPKHPSLSVAALGGDHLKVGYASGVIGPGHSVTVILEKGIYIIGCAYHYDQGMRDVLVVADRAKPGPQATPTPTPSPSPSTSPSTTPSLSPSPLPTGIVVTPSSVTVCVNVQACVSGSKTPNTANVTVSLPNYNGTFVVSDPMCTQGGYASVTPQSSTGTFTVTGGPQNFPWTCTATFIGGNSHGTLSITTVKQ